MDNNTKLNEQNNATSASISIGGSEYVREKVKNRPINRRKLIRRTILTVCMAVLFGLVSCITLLVLEPIINNIINPEEKPQVVTFPEETEEINPEDMYYDNMEMIEAEIMESDTYGPANGHSNSSNTSDGANIQDAPLLKRDYLMDYTQMYDALQHAGTTLLKSMVHITVNSNGTDILDNTYNITGETSGIIVAYNGLEYLILTNYNVVQDADEIYVKFNDNSTSTAEIKEYDLSTGLCILGVHISRLSNTTKYSVSLASLGRSNIFNLVGIPIVAVGSPAGVSNSTMYGMITSVGNDISSLDSRYKTLTTDIYGSDSAFGFIADLEGNVLGIINQTFAPDGCKNLITALGISELKLSIERMSNQRPRAILGLYGADINQQALNNSIKDIIGDDADYINPVTSGMFIKSIERESPAMAAGIQVGDIVVKINDVDISNLYDYAKVMNSLSPETEVNVTLLRFGPDGYTELEYTVTLTTQE